VGMVVLRGHAIRIAMNMTPVNSSALDLGHARMKTANLNVEVTVVMVTIATIRPIHVDAQAANAAFRRPPEAEEHLG